MARKKQKHPDSASQALDQIETRGDHLVEWVTDNPLMILGTAAGILLLVGAWALVADYAEGQRTEAARALSAVQADYRRAMGASPGSVELNEPANAETGRLVRTEYAAKYLEVGNEHEGSTAGALALLEASTLQQELDQQDEARATLERAVATTEAGDPVRPFLQLRLAALYEAAGRPADAAAAYEAVAAVAEFPLRTDALADAARCHADAGDRAAALAAFDRLERDAPGYSMPPYLRARLNEQRAAAAD